MPVIDHRDVLKGLTVQEAMRRQVISLGRDAPLEKAIRYTIKYKVNAILVTDEAEHPLGVVSKTDLMMAYYAGLPLTTPLSDIMAAPPYFCRAEDSLDAALEQMRESHIHRLYVLEKGPAPVAGVLAYPDIVGMLYRYCWRCERSILKGGKRRGMKDHLRVRDVMTTGVTSFPESATLAEVMEGLAALRLAAVLIEDAAGRGVGVVSKTDLILAYKHGLPVETAAGAVMNAPVETCPPDEFLARAIQQMIFLDLHRLFVEREEEEGVVGVLSLSDAARFRSGTCRACLVSRMTG